MRTKTLLMVAAIGAAGAVASQAQVFSVNAVGYVNKTAPANGYAMLANPLKAATNTINALFTGVPNGFQVYLYSPTTGYKTLTFDDLDGSFGADGNAELLPGQGVFVRSPSEKQITFVGEVMQGNLTTQLVPGLQIVSSQVPQQGTPTALGLTGVAGDQIYQFDVATQKYVISTYDDLDNKYLGPSGEPTIDVGEAFFLKKGAAGTWTRNFNVNQP
jgi:hypothetical protein